MTHSDLQTTYWQRSFKSSKIMRWNKANSKRRLLFISKTVQLRQWRTKMIANMKMEAIQVVNQGEVQPK